MEWRRMKKYMGTLGEKAWCSAPKSPYIWKGYRHWGVNMIYHKVVD